MIGPAEIEDMLAEYAEAVAAGDEDALLATPVWPALTRPICAHPMPALPDQD